MIKSLRLRFTLTAIASVFLVLILLIGGMNIVNYRKVVSDSDKVLTMLTENGGKFPDWRTRPVDSSRERPEDFNIIGRDRIDSPEIGFEIRYFSVVVGSDGTIGLPDTQRIYAVTSEDVQEYAKKVISKDNTSGFIGEYRYMCSPQTDGTTLIVFLDCGPSLSNFRNFLKISVVTSLVGLLLVSVVTFLVSGRVVKPVVESYEKQKRFITDAGHEIKTPLAISNADADVLEMDIGEDNEWVRDIKKQTSRLAELTNDLIFLSKMEEGKDSLVMEPTNLSSCVADQVDSFKSVAASKNIDFKSSIEEKIVVTCDKKAMLELTSILMDNAVKYCPEEGSISVDLKVTGKGVSLEVTNDTEEDISSEVIKNLFERFYRADDSHNSETGGYGIGLSIAKAIVKSHKGDIAAVKRKPKTISFVVTLRQD